MTRHPLPVDVPCAVCLTTITGWTGDDHTMLALPCRCSLADIRAVYDGVLARRIPAITEPKEE